MPAQPPQIGAGPQYVAGPLLAQLRLGAVHHLATGGLAIANHVRQFVVVRIEQPVTAG